MRPVALIFPLFALPMLAGQTAHAGNHRINAYLEPAGEVYLGEQLRLIVHVETDTWFTTAPKYPEIQIPGAIVLQPEAFGVNSSRREGSTTWSGQRQRYVLFPQRAGELTIPPIEIMLASAGDGSPGSLTRLVTPAVSTSVLVPPGATGAAAFVSTPRLRVQETWSAAPETLEVGDALVRAITRTADGTFALLLPPAEFTAPDGIAVYPDQPRLEDQSNRGQYEARRVDSVTYVLQAEGSFELPALRFQWFDSRGRTMREEVLPARTLEVAANPDAQLGEVPEPTIEESVDAGLARLVGWLRDNLIALTAAVLALWLTRLGWQRLAPGILVRYQRWRDWRRHGEPAYFGRVVAAARRRDADAFIEAFWAWSDRLPGRTHPLTLESLDPEGPPLDDWAGFRAGRYGGSRSGDTLPIPDDAIGQVQSLRQRWFQKRDAGRRRTLGLNP